MEGTVNPDLQSERERATFDPVKLTHILDRGANNTAQRHEIGNHLE